MNKFTCPGFVLCPLKPHPKGNEYHTICCDESVNIYGWEIVDGRDHPIPMGLPQLKTSTNMNMVGIMLWLERALWITGKAVIIDSGFCVLKGISKIRKREVYGSALIKVYTIGLRGFIKIVLTSTSGKKYWGWGISKWWMGWDSV